MIQGQLSYLMLQRAKSLDNEHQETTKKCKQVLDAEAKEVSQAWDEVNRLRHELFKELERLKCARVRFKAQDGNYLIIEDFRRGCEMYIEMEV